LSMGFGGIAVGGDRGSIGDFVVKLSRLSRI
jgi:hypothetical protein